jgi:ABC-type transport system involved in cytochrome bd biosynthesis fused ATPase/permease subunit
VFGVIRRWSMPVVFEPTNAAEVLGGMITPAVLISASGTLALSTTNRLGRIVDRVRDLLKQAEELPPWNPTDEDAQAKRSHIADQISHQSARVRLLQVAVTCLYAAIALLVGSSLGIGLSAVAMGLFAWAPVALGLLGACALLLAAALLMRDARLAVRSTLSEMEYIHRMVARRTGAPLPPPHPAAGAGPAPPA